MINVKHGQGTHCTKMGADELAENTPNAPKLICPNFEAFSTRYWHLWILKPRALFYIEQTAPADPNS